MATYQFEGQDIVAPVIIKSNEPVFSADSVSLKVRRVKQGAQRWELEFGVTLTDASSFLPDMLDSFHDAITMEMPQLNARGQTISHGTSTAAVSTSGTTAAGASSVALTGANGTIAKGRFVKFSNHDKLYLVKAEYNGSGNISLYPSLRLEVPSATSLLYRDGTDAITFTAYRDISNVQGITFVDGILSDAGNINLIEAL
jgi:hypothetical protein